jgi:threonine dehydrogenase-like Zn-dependent dehydrogenase
MTAMQALVYEAPNQMHMREIAVPTFQPDEVLIKVAYSGICGSELSGFLGQNSLRKPPLVFGHEFSGWIEQIGVEAGKRFPALSVGQTVTANPLISCGHCLYCLTGRQQLCPERKLHSAHLPGSNAEYLTIRADAIVPLPQGMSLTTAALSEPVAVAVHCAELLHPRPQEVAFVIGAGPIGLLMIEALHNYGVKTIYCADLNAERLAMAKDLGAIPAQLGDSAAAQSSDIVVDAVGVQATRTACFQLARGGARVAFLGLHEADSSLPINHIIRQEIVCFGSFAYSAVDFQQAVQGLADGRYWLKPEWTRVEPLEHGASCFEELLDGSAVAKIWLKPSEVKT